MPEPGQSNEYPGFVNLSRSMGYSAPAPTRIGPGPLRCPFGGHSPFSLSLLRGSLSQRGPAFRSSLRSLRAVPRRIPRRGTAEVPRRRGQASNAETPPTAETAGGASDSGDQGKGKGVQGPYEGLRPLGECERDGGEGSRMAGGEGYSLRQRRFQGLGAHPGGAGGPERLGIPT